MGSNVMEKNLKKKYFKVISKNKETVNLDIALVLWFVLLRHWEYLWDSLQVYTCLSV